MADNFAKRLAVHQEEFQRLYDSLYHSQAAYDDLIAILKDCYKARPQELKKLDNKRLADEEWYKKRGMLGMLMYVDCFAGNLQGVIDNFDYIRECNVNYLHLMPLLKSPEGRNDGGYAVSDFTQVSEKLGTIDDLKRLASLAHKYDVSICLDFVMNHTSEDHEWAKRARAGEKEYQDRYFVYDTWDIPQQFERTVPQVFPTTAPGNFTFCEEMNKVVMTTFYPYQWDLNYRNPVVFNQMTAFMLNLCNHGVDIIRLDATPYIWKQLGTDCRNLPEVHTLVRLLRIICEIVAPGTLLLGEVVMEPSKVVPYFGTIEAPECHMLYNVTTMASTWNTVATRDVRLLRHQLNSVFALPDKFTFLNYLRCHDDIGWGLEYAYLRRFGIEEVPHKRFLNDYFTGKFPGSLSKGELYNDDPRLGDARLVGMSASLVGLEKAVADNDLLATEKALSYLEMLNAFLLTQSGIPVIYSGDETGQFNDYSYHLDPNKQADSRYLHRGALNQENVANRHDLTTLAGRIFTRLNELEQIRFNNSVFDQRALCRTIDAYNDHILVIERKNREQKLLALFNFSEGGEVAWINEEGVYRDLLSNEILEGRNVAMKAQSFRWLLEIRNA